MKKRNFPRRMGAMLLTLALALSLVVPAGAADEGNTDPSVVQASNVKLDRTSIELEVGKQGHLTATVSPPDATVQSVIWESDNTSVVYVQKQRTASGEPVTIVAGSSGTATITATAEGAASEDVFVTCTVTVTNTPIPVTDIFLEPGNSALTLNKDDEQIFTASVDPGNATDRTVTWVITKGSAFISFTPGDVWSATGNTVTVTAKKAGTATLQAQAGNVIKTCKITVKDPATKVELNKTSINLDKGKTDTLIATVTPSTTTDTVTWKSSDEKVATVSNNGLVTAVGGGTAEITATAGSVTSEKCTVTVNIPTTGVSLNKTSTSLSVGGTETLTATVLPANATNKNVRWTSDTPAIASVTQNGRVMAKTEGTATITVTTEDGGKTASCTVTVTPPPVAVTGVTLDPTTLALEVGGSGTLTATVEPDNATNKNVTWTSDKPEIAEVDTSGNVTAKAKGTATITATADGGKTASCTVNVTAVDVIGITLDQNTLELDVNKSETLTATVVPENATNKKVTWTSDKPEIAEVDDNGNVTGKADGTATITATTEDRKFTATCTVTVTFVHVGSITLDNTLTLNMNEAKQLTATILPDNATNKNVTWSSSDDKIAAVDGHGNVTGKTEGTATITATTEDGGKIAECAVTVKSIPVEAVSLNKEKLELTIGQTGTLSAIVEPTSATDPTVTWSSSNEKIATVKDGTVTAVALGKATITAKAGDKTKTCEVTVVPVTVSSIIISSYDDANKPLILDKIGQQELVRVLVMPENATNKTVAWKSNDTNIAKVDNGGYVTAVAVGRTTITAKAGDHEVKFAVEVSGVRLDKTSASLLLNKSDTIGYQAFGNAKGTGSGVTVQRYWQSDDPLVAAVDRNTGRISGRGVGETDVKFTYAVNGTSYAVPVVHVTVIEDTGNIYTDSATAGAPYLLSDIMSALNAMCSRQTGYGLSYITNVMVSPKEGVMYYTHISSEDTGFGVGATEQYYYSEKTIGQRYLSGLTFVPNSDFNGDTTITFTGYNTQGKSFQGKIRLTVTGSGNVTFITKAGVPVTFSSANFSAACRSETGREVDNVSFELPGGERGVLYYGRATNGEYRYLVTANDQYYRTRTPYLDQVTFVPGENYIGDLHLNFYGEDTVSSRFTGKLHIIVVPSRRTGQYDELTTTVPRDSTVDFNKFDFQTVCQELMGESLSYVRFTPPVSSVGTLYYNYSSSGKYDSLVNANTRYYPSRTPKLSDLTFVPANGRTEPVTIDFVGYTTSGKSFEETVTIYLREADSSGDVITYAVTSGQAIPFEWADFDGLCQKVTGKDLNRIMFQYLPDSSEGTLYYNYNTGSSTGTKVTTKTNLYRSTLTGTAFAPRSDFVGMVELEFIGYTTTGARFTGMVRIDVEEGNTTLRYSVNSGSSVSFNAGDFNTVCKQATNGNLNYVRFQLPKSTEGTLYYRSNTSSTTKNKVSSSSSYYYSTSGSNRIGNVLFTAAGNFTGLVTIDYTGFSTSGARFTGTVEVDVSYHHSTTLYYAATSEPFRIPAESVFSTCSPLLEKDPSYVLITSLPKEEQGKLYYDYVGYGTGSLAKTSTKYYKSKASYLDRVVFVPKEGYTGTVTLPYTAYDTRGDTVSGTINIEVTQPTTSSFSDMDNYAWAIPSVEFLDNSGVVEGIGSGLYNPSGNIRRGDFVLMLFRMYNFSDAGTKSFSDVPEDSYYARAIASAKAKKVVTGENNQFRPSEPITRQDAMLFLRNAMRAAGKSVPTGSTSLLYDFTDYNSVSSEARSAVISMIQLDIIRGDNYRRLNPTSFITRAEAAAILHRAMTL